MGSECSVLFGLESFDSAHVRELHEISGQGITATSVEAYCQQQGQDVDSLLKSLDLSRADFGGYMDSAERLPEAWTERILRHAKLMSLAIEILGTSQSAEQWVSNPVPALDNARPINLIRTGFGFEEAKQTLRRIQYGNLA